MYIKYIDSEKIKEEVDSVLSATPYHRDRTCFLGHCFFSLPMGFLLQSGDWIALLAEKGPSNNCRKEPNKMGAICFFRVSSEVEWLEGQEKNQLWLQDWKVAVNLCIYIFVFMYTYMYMLKLMYKKLYIDILLPNNF